MAKQDAKSKLQEETGTTPAAAPAGKFTRKKAVSVPQLKLSANNTVYIQVLSLIKTIELNDKDAEGGKSSCEAITVCDLSDGEIKQLLLDKIPGEAFALYGDKLEGMAFEVTKGTKVQSGKNGYHPYTIYEIEVGA